MPRLEDYYCDDCREWDIDHLHMEWPAKLPECTQCGKPMRRVYSKMNFKLRGLGWRSDGFSTDIDQAELEWERDKPCSAPTSYIPNPEDA
jgi:predicted nucleic acid-binding Zn ribbon protein